MHDHTESLGPADHDDEQPDVPAPSIFVCFESDQSISAQRIDGWERTNADLAEYSARTNTPINAPAAEAIKARVAAQIAAADVIVCVIGPTTWLCDWVTWELKTAKSSPRRKGLVAVMLHDRDLPPQELQGCGAVFVRLRREQLEGAIVYAQQVPDTTDDFMFLDD